MRLIVGLGNFGEKYEGTRHNLGFMVVDHFLKDATLVRDSRWTHEARFKGDTSFVNWKPKSGEEQKLVLLKPRTFMNLSGLAVQYCAEFYKITADNIWIIHDELDLPVGSMKIRLGGAAAGHHGVEHIIETLGTDKFWRFRMGIGAARNHDEVAKHTIRNAEDFVLGSFRGKEISEIKKLVKHGSDALQMALEKGLDTAMNRYNTK